METKYEVQEFTLFDGWINTWTFMDDDGDTSPSFFDTYQEAKDELLSFISDMRREYKAGNVVDVPDLDFYRIVEVRHE